MGTEVQNIIIASVDSQGIQRAIEDEDLFEIPFKLSSAPPEKWIQLFNESWEKWKAEAPNNFAMKRIRIIGVLLEVTVDYNTLASGSPSERFKFAKLLEGLRATVNEVNETYKQRKRRENEQVFALKAMVEKLQF